MAVQAQYPANLLQINSKDMDFPQSSPVFFPSNGENANPPPAMVGRSPVNVSTGLRLALNEQNQMQSSDSILCSFLSEELAKQTDEIEMLLLSHREQLRRALMDRRYHHYCASLTMAGKYVDRRIREKEAEVEIASRRNLELEDRLARLRSESMNWQSKAMAGQAMAASLRSQIQRAAVEAEIAGETLASDCESAFVDPERAEIYPPRACRNCLRRTASVVLIPCRHLCLCPACDFACSGENCPVCGELRTGSVHVFFS